MFYLYDCKKFISDFILYKVLFFFNHRRSSVFSFFTFWFFICFRLWKHHFKHNRFYWLSVGKTDSEFNKKSVTYSALLICCTKTFSISGTKRKKKDKINNAVHNASFNYFFIFYLMYKISELSVVFFLSRLLHVQHAHFPAKTQIFGS